MRGLQTMNSYNIDGEHILGMPRDLCTAPRIILLSPLSLATDVTDATLGASGLWLGTRTGAGSTATLTESFFGRSPWLHGQHTWSPMKPTFHVSKMNSNSTSITKNRKQCINWFTFFRKLKGTGSFRCSIYSFVDHRGATHMIHHWKMDPCHQNA